MNVSLRICRALSSSYTQRLKYSSKLPAEFIVPLNNDTIVCWHPEQEFPYEYSLPVPEQKVVESDSVLRFREGTLNSVHKPKRPAAIVEELAKVTFTAKNRWYPRSRDKKAKKTPPDRPYL